MNDCARKIAAFYLSSIEALRQRQEGATAAEYGLLVALISVVIIATVTLLGQEISDTFEKVRAAIETGNNAG